MQNFEKIIWQTHKWEYEDLPELYKKTSYTWQKWNPDWEYRYIPNSLIRDEIEKLGNEKLLSFFDSQQDPMQRADVYREAMVYYHGGLWADMDSVCLYPIDKVIINNTDKDMICISPIIKFGMDPDKNYETQHVMEAIDKLLSNVECGHWISNAVFLGKKYNKISEEIINGMTNEWNFRETSFMGTRAELYEKYHSRMSLDLMCAFHDARFNLRNN